MFLSSQGIMKVCSLLQDVRYKLTKQIEDQI